MKLVVDENIPLAQAFFSQLGEVVPLPGRELCAADVRDADALIVRSVTRVDETLLAGSAVSFVGTCTIGVDHLDQGYLEERGIAVASAPGCNANSVVEYVFSALSALDQPWQGKLFGIIGCGNVGGHLYRRLRALGIACRCYDPFLTDANNPDLCSLAEVLQADIVCLHTPLTVDGPHPSHHLLGKRELRTLGSGTLLINAGRGAAIDNAALLEVLAERPDLQVVLDVWEPEPALNPELLAKVALGTPHIAGYSYDGKVRGTEMIYQALCRHLRQAPRVSAAQLLRPEGATLGLTVTEDWPTVRAAVLGAYDIRDDDRRLRAAAADPVTLPAAFDQLRKHYPQRREFFNYAVALADAEGGESVAEKNKPLSETLAALGFAQE